MKVSELIDILKEQDQSALVEVRSEDGAVELLQDTGVTYLKSLNPGGHNLLVLEGVT